MIGKYESFCVDNLSKEERICAYVITWILLPRGNDQSLLNAEDVYLLYALPTKTQTDWASVIGDYMLKIAKQKEYHLPYVVLISRILRLQNVDTTNEITNSCSKKNLIEKLFLDHMRLIKSKKGWIFKEEYLPGIDERFKRLDEKMLMLQRSFTELHWKMDYALRINAFCDTSVDDSESENNSANEKIVESSETE